MTRMKETSAIPEAIFAYELTNLSDALRGDTLARLDTVERLRPVLRQHVADLYLIRAEELLAEGDSLQAADFRAFAEDWMLPVEPDPDR